MPYSGYQYFVIHEMGLAKIYLCMKFEVSSFTCFKFLGGVLRFKNSAPGCCSAYKSTPCCQGDFSEFFLLVINVELLC